MARSVLGTFRGKCCDSNVFNNNDMHLGREVFEKLLASEEYRRALELGHYIGFLGHPENPDCQDFEHACIVMTDQKLLDNGEVEANFDLVDTPVGRIVKAFTDAGVQFGISIRGVGDVDGNGEVDPDEFIFRGYDLVTFPAYDDCIPEFREIAASTDVKKKAKYKKICAAIDANLKDIKSCSALELIKEQLPQNDAEFIKVQERIDELNGVDEAEIIAQVNQQKLDAVTELYLDAAAKVRKLECELASCQCTNNELVVECSSLKRKQSRLNRIVANQVSDAKKMTAEALTKADSKASQLENSKKHVADIRASLTVARRELSDTRKQLAEVQKSYDQQVLASKRLKERLTSLTSAQKDNKEAIKASENLNLKYQRKIENSSKLLSERNSEITQLTNKVNETVMASKELRKENSSLKRENEQLTAKITATEDIIYAYQQAYANLYANALGVHLTGLPVTASTSVEELKNMITAGTSTANIAARPAFNTELISSDEDEDDNELDGEYIHGEEDEFDDGTQYSADLTSI